MASLKAPKAVWATVLGRLDGIDFTKVPRPLTSAAMDALPELEQVQESVTKTTQHLLQQHAKTEDGEMVKLDEPADDTVQVGQEHVPLEDPEAFQRARKETLREEVELDVRLLSISDIGAALGQVRNSPLRIFVAELLPDGVERV